MRKLRPVSASEVQYGQDAGQCLESLVSGEVVSVTDTALEDRWDTCSGTRRAKESAAACHRPPTGGTGPWAL